MPNPRRSSGTPTLGNSTSRSYRRPDSTTTSQVTFLACAAAGLLAVLGVLLLRTPWTLAGLAALAASAFLTAFLVPLEMCVFLWFALLPMWKLGPLTPGLMDACRIGLGLCIALRAKDRVPIPRPEAATWTVIGALALVTSAVGGFRPDPADLNLGIHLLIAAFLILCVVHSTPRRSVMVAGLVTGEVMSSLVAVGTVLGLPGLAALAANSNAGFGRVAGLNSSAPRLSAELACAILLLIMALARRVTATRVAALAACGLGLLVSGGRTGLLMIAFALVAGALTRRIPLKHLVGVGLFFVCLVPYLVAKGVELGTLTRLLDDTSAAHGPSGIDNGRLALNGEAWRAFVAHPVLGSGNSGFAERFGATAHTPVLAFAVACGVLGFVLVIIGIGRMLALAAHSMAVPALRPYTALIPAGLTAYAAVDPIGPFSGLTCFSLLSISYLELAQYQAAAAKITAVGALGHASSQNRRQSRSRVARRSRAMISTEGSA